MFEGRHFSTALDQPHLWICVCYIERNPVRAARPRAVDWPLSSARHHALSEADGLLGAWRPVSRAPRCRLAGLACPAAADEQAEMARGRPCGDPAWVRSLEQFAGRRLAALPSGRPRTVQPDDDKPDLLGGER